MALGLTTLNQEIYRFISCTWEFARAEIYPQIFLRRQYRMNFSWLIVIGGGIGKLGPFRFKAKLRQIVSEGLYR